MQWTSCLWRARWWSTCCSCSWRPCGRRPCANGKKRSEACDTTATQNEWPSSSGSSYSLWWPLLSVSYHPMLLDPRLRAGRVCGLIMTSIGRGPAHSSKTVQRLKIMNRRYYIFVGTSNAIHYWIGIGASRYSLILTIFMGECGLLKKVTIFRWKEKLKNQIAQLFVHSVLCFFFDWQRHYMLVVVTRWFFF